MREIRDTLISETGTVDVSTIWKTSNITIQKNGSRAEYVQDM